MRAVGLAARLRAVALACVVLGGWFGLPAADVLLYHTRSPKLEHADTQVGRTGESPGHWLHCTLGSDCARPRFTAPVAVFYLAVLPTRDRQSSLSRTLPREQVLGGLPQERSPPTPA
jgi:hypothetical protein